MLLTLQITSGLAFLTYGALCVFSGAMREEFKRYGLSQFRLLVGVLEILGGLGNLLGIRFDFFLYSSSIGLSCLMFLGVCTRLRAKDPLIQTVPAWALMIVNVLILFLHSS